MNSIYEAISIWLRVCPEVNGYTYFNVIPMIPDTASVNSNSSSDILNKFIDGSMEVRLLFNINLVKSYDEGTSDLNLEAINSFDEITKFIEDMNLKQKFPILGDNYIVNEIGSLYKAPEVYTLQEDTSIARYEGQFYIQYLQMKGD
jgi:hypothetical protein|nr:MAG TPA: Minor capsid protein from bacteriophage [Caudoviricetes sp.]